MEGACADPLALAADLTAPAAPECDNEELTGYDALRITKGKEAMRDYKAVPSNWPEGDINHYMCPHCGAHTFSRGYLDFMGGNFWAVNVACLDDATEEELGAAPIVYEDGKHDRQLEPPAITSYL